MSERNDGGPAIVTDESVTFAGKTVAHNEFPWRTAKNRHSNTDGTAWGWIESAPSRVCWSDNERFNREAAHEIVRAHNQWLEDQRPLSIKIIQAKREYEDAKAEFERLDRLHTEALIRMNLANDELAALLAAREES